MGYCSIARSAQAEDSVAEPMPEFLTIPYAEAESMPESVPIPDAVPEYTGIRPLRGHRD